MKIILICSSLEQGCDGVGDYSMRLAAELIKQGNMAGILSLNDKYVSDVFSGFQQSDGVDVQVMRIPSSLTKKDRFVYAKNWIDQQGPDWLSLQFVPFGFHSKGLPFKLASSLSLLGANRYWHIMFHELWVGMASEEPVKLIWWGWLQRRIIKYLLLKLRPKIIHTQTSLYQALLGKLGFNARLMPLFGNIPIDNKVKIITKHSDISLIDKKEIDFIVFGAIHSGAPIAEFAKEAALYSQKNKVPVKLTFIGRCGSEQGKWLNAWQAEGLAADVLGEQSAERISEVLLNSTAGISATALAVIEKSGSFAAMSEHNLPVISVSKAWTPIKMPKPTIPAGIVEYRIGNFEACMATKINLDYTVDVSIVAIQLIKSISNVPE